ncbi:MAG: 4-hydroxy-tetrahydrodipicolinate synthase [Planctomycetes bacterium SM23_65]|nr:MAG: 4-hydroxy-tetrahydrodipicolinate synthase [Planctomycetes bacterium SM23_65]
MFSGSIVAIVTPFKKGEVDFDKLDELVEMHVEAGTDAIVPCGTTGESPTLSHDEHDAVIERVVHAVNKRCPVIAGTGSNSTAEAIRLTQHAEKVGADGSLQVCPYYNKPTQEGLYQHFKAVAESVSIPIVLYNIPSRSGRNIDVDTMVRLAKVKNVVAVKSAAGSTDQVTEIILRTDLTVLSGDDSMTLPFMALGAKGVISVVANIVPKDVNAMVHAFLDGDAAGAQKLNARLYPLAKAMFVETNPGPVKAAMAMLGMIDREMRLPMVPPSGTSEAKIRQALHDYGLL